MDWIRALLPGVFTEVNHWKQRALRAESCLDSVIAQYSTVIAHEREQHAAERREFMNLLAGNTSQKPPLPASDEGGSFTATSSFIHPMNRIIEEYKTKQASLIPDEVVELATEEYLRMNAVH